MSRPAPRADLEACVFFIEDAQGRACGTAFLVAGKEQPYYLATDTHVLEQCWKMKQGSLLNRQSAPQRDVLVRCDKNGTLYRAQLTRYLSPFECDDVAFLLPLDELPSEVHPARLAQWKGKPWEKFHTRGLRDAAEPAIGEITGSSKIDAFPKRQKVLVLHSDQISEGMSGAPVALTSGEVIGMVLAHWIPREQGGPDRNTAYAIPAETLAAVCDDLRVSWDPPKSASFLPEWIEVAGFLPLAMVFVPAGEFVMGHTERKGRQELGEGHSPRHRFSPEAYAISKFLITNELFAAFMRETGYSFQGNCSDPAIARHPVVRVTWFDAAAFCTWLDKLGPWPRSYQVRLATEAEWEKAMRGPGGLLFPWGSKWEPGHCNASIKETSSGTTPIGSFSPLGDSPYGCADGVGNVWEWTLGKPVRYHYTNDERNAYDETSQRVLRGGSWNVSTLEQLHTYFRLAMDPTTASVQNGFRIVLGPRLFSEDQ